MAFISTPTTMSILVNGKKIALMDMVDIYLEMAIQHRASLLMGKYLMGNMLTTMGIYIKGK